MGCSRDTTPSPTPPGEAEASGGTDVARVAVQLNWYPETEHGGVYQAVADGTYAAAGLNVDIRPGGRATPVAPELDLGRCQFAITNADDVVQFRREGSKVVAVLSALQNHPRCILVRQDSGVDSLEELAGMKLQCQPGRGFLSFMRQRGLLEGVQEVPYHGSISSLANDPKIAIQAYSFAEPLLAEQQNIATRSLMVSDLGWNPYSSVLITTEAMIDRQPEVVAAMVQATITGWKNYFADPAQGNALILKANRHGMTPEVLEYGARQMLPLAMPAGFDPERLGQMTSQRWETLVDQIDSFDPELAGQVKAEDCFTLRFLK